MRPKMTLAKRRNRDQFCLNMENQCVGFFRRNPDDIPDGSFMRMVFKRGYDAAIRDCAPTPEKPQQESEER